MRQRALALCVCVSVCVSRAALLPVASLRTRLPQCRARAGVIRGAAPDNVLTGEDALAAQRRVWALIFNYRSENEGIYTQQRGDGREYVLTWQAEEDATRYGDMLSDAQDFPEGTAVEMETQTLLDFCKEAGHTLCLVPSSTVVIPPGAMVEVPPLAVPEVGSRASSGHAWQLWLARRSQGSFRATGPPASASGAQASRLQSRRFPRL